MHILVDGQVRDTLMMSTIDLSALAGKQFHLWLHLHLDDNIKLESFEIALANLFFQNLRQFVPIC